MEEGVLAMVFDLESTSAQCKKGGKCPVQKRGPDTTSRYLATRESSKIKLDNLETTAVR